MEAQGRKKLADVTFNKLNLTSIIFGQQIEQWTNKESKTDAR